MKRLSRSFALVGLLVVTSLPAMSGIAQAAGTVTITGKTPRNYTVLMVGKNGNSTAVKGGNFKLKVSANTAKDASLHLVSSNGTYSGPVVLKYDKKKKVGNTLLSGKSGDVGSIAMKTGYSIAAAKKTTAISTSTKIPVSTSGKPSGAGRMGIPTSVQAKAVRAFGVSKWADGDAPNGADTDKDGLPNTLDIDDDDDGKIDLVDDSNPSKAITTGSLLFLDISKTINLHAGMNETSMQAAIDSIFKSNNNFWIGLGLNTGSQEAPDGIHISCASDVAWCAPSSPATLFGTGTNGAPEKWVDKKADGFGLSLPKGNGPNCDSASSPMLGGMCSGPSTNFNRQFIPQLPSADVMPGSLFTMNFTKGGAIAKSVAGTLSPYFASVPALKEITVGGQVKNIDYSLKGVSGIGGASGTQGNPIVVPVSNKSITLTFWRPQRSGVSVAGEGKYVDMGSLRYGFYIGVNRICDSGAMTPVSPTLLSSAGGQEFAHTPLLDTAKDSVPDSGNTLSFTVNLSKCEGGTAPTIGASAQMVTLIASSPGNPGIKAYQDFYVKVQ